jgi:predicted short-subunit dehydrogenase-like oxidoreductase (DUF2520 family)
MKLSIIGSGNVATVIGKKLLQQGFEIIEVYSRNSNNAESLAKVLSAKAINDIQQISLEADAYIIAVADKALMELAPTLNLPNKLVLHTAGSVSIDVLKQCSTQYGVLYPVQSMRMGMDIATPIPFLIDGSNEAVLQQIEQMAFAISNKVEKGNDEQRLKLHVAAVFVCNFVNFMYLQSAAFCEKEGIDFSLLQPLMEETANRIQTAQPATVFTGPAVRGDMGTIAKHLAVLAPYPQMQELYQRLTDSIIAFAISQNKE